MYYALLYAVAVARGGTVTLRSRSAARSPLHNQGLSRLAEACPKGSQDLPGTPSFAAAFNEDHRDSRCHPGSVVVGEDECEDLSEGPSEDEAGMGDGDRNKAAREGGRGRPRAGDREKGDAGLGSNDGDWEAAESGLSRGDGKGSVRVEGGAGAMKPLDKAAGCGGGEVLLQDRKGGAGRGRGCSGKDEVGTGVNSAGGLEQGLGAASGLADGAAAVYDGMAGADDGFQQTRQGAGCGGSRTEVAALGCAAGSGWPGDGGSSGTSHGVGRQDLEHSGRGQQQQEQQKQQHVVGSGGPTPRGGRTPDDSPGRRRRSTMEIGSTAAVDGAVHSLRRRASVGRYQEGGDGSTAVPGNDWQERLTAAASRRASREVVPGAPKVFCSAGGLIGCFSKYERGTGEGLQQGFSQLGAEAVFAKAAGRGSMRSRGRDGERGGWGEGGYVRPGSSVGGSHEWEGGNVGAGHAAGSGEAAAEGMGHRETSGVRSAAGGRPRRSSASAAAAADGTSRGGAFKGDLGQWMQDGSSSSNQAYTSDVNVLPAWNGDAEAAANVAGYCLLAKGPCYLGGADSSLTGGSERVSYLKGPDPGGGHCNGHTNDQVGYPVGGAEGPAAASGGGGGCHVQTVAGPDEKERTWQQKQQQQQQEGDPTQWRLSYHCIGSTQQQQQMGSRQSIRCTGECFCNFSGSALQQAGGGAVGTAGLVSGQPQQQQHWRISSAGGWVVAGSSGQAGTAAGAAAGGRVKGVPWLVVQGKSIRSLPWPQLVRMLTAAVERSARKEAAAAGGTDLAGKQHQQGKGQGLEQQEREEQEQQQWHYGKAQWHQQQGWEQQLVLVGRASGVGVSVAGGIGGCEGVRRSVMMGRSSAQGGSLVVPHACGTDTAVQPPHAAERAVVPAAAGTRVIPLIQPPSNISEMPMAGRASAMAETGPGDWGLGSHEMESSTSRTQQQQQQWTKKRSVLARAAWLRSCHRVLADKGYNPEFLEMQLGAVLLDALSPRGRVLESSADKTRGSGVVVAAGPVISAGVCSGGVAAFQQDEVGSCAEAEAAGAYAWFNQWLQGEGLLPTATGGEGLLLSQAGAAVTTADPQGSAGLNPEAAMAAAAAAGKWMSEAAGLSQQQQQKLVVVAGSSANGGGCGSSNSRPSRRSQDHVYRVMWGPSTEVAVRLKASRGEEVGMCRGQGCVLNRSPSPDRCMGHQGMAMHLHPHSRQQQRIEQQPQQQVGCVDGVQSPQQQQREAGQREQHRQWDAQVQQQQQQEEHLASHLQQHEQFHELWQEQQQQQLVLPLLPGVRGRALVGTVKGKLQQASGGSSSGGDSTSKGLNLISNDGSSSGGCKVVHGCRAGRFRAASEGGPGGGSSGGDSGGSVTTTAATAAGNLGSTSCIAQQDGSSSRATCTRRNPAGRGPSFVGDPGGLLVVSTSGQGTRAATGSRGSGCGRGLCQPGRLTGLDCSGSVTGGLCPGVGVPGSSKKTRTVQSRVTADQLIVSSSSGGRGGVGEQALLGSWTGASASASGLALPTVLPQLPRRNTTCGSAEMLP